MNFKIVSNWLSDGLEIKDNEEILYSLVTEPSSLEKSLVFYNLKKNEKIKTLNYLNIWSSNTGERIIKLNNEIIAIAGGQKVYLINKYSILNEINSVYINYSILKLTNNLFLIGDENGIITQYRIENTNIIKESLKKSHENEIYSLTILNDMIISGSLNSNEIKIWKK